MNSREIQIEVIECGMTGEIGLAPQGANIAADDYMADTTGVLMAHDLLEHVNGAEHIGGIGDELEALGAIWYGRGQTSSMNRRDNAGSMHSSEDHIASDVERMARDFVYKGFERTIPENVETDSDETLRYIIARGIRGARTEFNYESDHLTPEEMSEARASMREYASNCLAFMQAGYNKAEAAHPCEHEFANLFWAVADALQPFAEQAEYVGQEYSLTITEDGRAFVEEYYETEPELSCDDCSEYFEPDGEEYINSQGYTQCGGCVAKEEAA